MQSRVLNWYYRAIIIKYGVREDTINLLQTIHASYLSGHLFHKCDTNICPLKKRELQLIAIWSTVSTTFAKKIFWPYFLCFLSSSYYQLSIRIIIWNRSNNFIFGTSFNWEESLVPKYLTKPSNKLRKSKIYMSISCLLILYWHIIKPNCRVLQKLKTNSIVRIRFHKVL